MRHVLGLAIGLACGADAHLHGAEVRLHASTDRTRVFIGETLILNVRVEGADTGVPQPDVSGIRDANVEFLGTQSRSNYSITIVNGQVVKSGFAGREFTYRLTPTRTGTITAGPIALTVNGRTCTAAGTEIQVDGIEKQNDVLISVSASKDAVLVDEPFDVTLTVALKRLSGRLAGIEPLNPNTPPVLSVPYLDWSDQRGLNLPDVKKSLQPLVVRNRNVPGFAVNEYTVPRDPFDMFDFGNFFQEQRAKFVFPRREVSLNGLPYFEYTLKLPYLARQEAIHTFGPVLFKGEIVLGADAAGNAVTRRVFAVGPACTVRVVPPPEEGRPPWFIGAVGPNLTVKAALDTQTCNVGDPLTLTLSVSGRVNLNSLVPPNLSAQSDVVRDFRVYEDTVQTVSREEGRDYIYTLRPTRAGTLEFPAVKIAYFDANDRQYRTVQTRPLPVRANPAAEVAQGMIIGLATNRIAVVDRGAAEDRFVVAPLDMNRAGAQPATLFGPRWQFGVAALGPVACAAAFSIRQWRIHSPRSRRARRQRRALSIALAALRPLGHGAPDEALPEPEAVCDALRNYLADRLDVSATALTPSEARHTLQRAGLNHDLIDRFCGLLESSFNARFGGSTGGAVRGDPASEAQTVLADVDRSLRHSHPDGEAEP